jgi:hypothetical protein
MSCESVHAVRRQHLRAHDCHGLGLVHQLHRPRGDGARENGVARDNLSHASKHWELRKVEIANGKKSDKMNDQSL